MVFLKKITTQESGGVDDAAPPVGKEPNNSFLKTLGRSYSLIRLMLFSFVC